MVKTLDDIAYPELIDHVGWRLWRLSRAWKAQFEAGMVALGHGWFGEARAGVLAHLGPNGLPQSALPGRMGLTKQAVQQLVDDLARDGIVERRPDPQDGRGRLVVLTPAGLAVMTDANAVKLRIEAEYRALLGPDGFAALNHALDLLYAGTARRPGQA
ncbi:MULTISPECIES: MarR family winged helix-turn-helix transcriptional regulator [Inquilinus]|jgi:DNA-binding MarR family transcriptional regulator|uniref:DNA-binding MarR family transcriptional regulator n=1 Tax=Inquilinus ginsengisoli TaxID=363840 RepID=A0ABU1JQQ7_9PROT|nr:MarR family winged helix-turn-helix transcriptional regulator [Inquilinus ginsengisoli]MDR6289864.1 DNA-binding MarR family transcriptional regulator [Inquilinus ginsengisoli]